MDEEKDEVMARLRALWSEFPQLRLGQLIMNAFPGCPELYYIKDEDLLDKLESLYSNLAERQARLEQ